MDTFKAFRIYNENDKVAGRVSDVSVNDLKPGEVVFRNAFSSVNYKDALAGTGMGGKIIRSCPLVGGMHAAGTVLVTGATGGVATLAIDMLARNGYEVTAVTGKDAEHAFLKDLGAREVLSRASIDPGKRPLEKSLWAAAFDSVGGEQLAWLTRTMHTEGLIASFGNAGGIELHTTVLPFILRGVRLIGINSATTPMPLRRKVWNRLASDLKPGHLDRIAYDIGLEGLPGQFEKLLKG